MCSDDCDRFCEGQSDCRCHTCPEAGATETWDCSVGDEMACYDQVLYCWKAGRQAGRYSVVWYHGIVGIGHVEMYLAAQTHSL